ERIEGDDRLSGADVALEQPLHGHGSREVGVDLLDRALLMLGQRERKRRAIARHQLARLAEGHRDRRLTLLRHPREPELEHEQLLEREPEAAALGLPG